MLTLSGDSTSDPASARRFVHEALAGTVSDAVSGDLQLAASELVTNAVRHALPSPVRVTVHADGQRASVTVESESSPNATLADVSTWAMSPPDQVGGRGLGIVRAVCDDIDVARDGTTLSITAYRNLA